MRAMRVFPISGWASPIYERDAAAFVLWLERRMPCGPHPTDSITHVLKKNGFENSFDKCMLEGKIKRDGETRRSQVLVSREFLHTIKSRPEFYLELLGRGVQNEAILETIGERK